MKRRTLLLALLAAGLSVLAGSADAAGPSGLRLSVAEATASSAGTRIHGSVCRTGPLPAGDVGAVQAERLDDAGRVTATAQARASRPLSGRRGLGCAAYDLSADWTVAPAEALRICAAVRPGAARTCAFAAPRG